MAIGLISSPATWNVGTVVAPAWCQGVQDNVNGWLAGTNSMLGLEIDGAGGLPVTPVAGTLRVGGTGIAGITSTPTPTPQIGRLYRELLPVQYGRFTYSGGAGGSFGLVQGYNISAFARSSAGVYTAQFATTPPSWTGTGVCIASISNTLNGSTYTIFTDTDLAHSIIKFLNGASAADPASAVTVSFMTFGI